MLFGVLLLVLCVIFFNGKPQRSQLLPSRAVLNLAGNGVLPLSQLAITEELPTLVAAMDKETGLTQLSHAITTRIGQEDIGKRASAGSEDSPRSSSDVAHSSQSIECVSCVISSGRWLTRGEARERFLGRKLERSANRKPNNYTKAGLANLTIKNS